MYCPFMLLRLPLGPRATWKPVGRSFATCYPCLLFQVLLPRNMGLVFCLRFSMFWPMHPSATFLPVSSPKEPCFWEEPDHVHASSSPCLCFCLSPEVSSFLSAIWAQSTFKIQASTSPLNVTGYFGFSCSMYFLVLLHSLCSYCLARLRTL